MRIGGIQPGLRISPGPFPTDLRASGIGLAIAASRTGSAISTFLLDTRQLASLAL